MTIEQELRELARLWPAQPMSTAAHLVRAADRIATLEAALREIARLRLSTDEGTMRQRFDKAWDLAEKTWRATAETKCEHSWSAVSVFGDNGVKFECSKCGDTKLENPPP